jgi:ribosome-binding factor A
MTTGGEVKRAVRVAERVREELAAVLRTLRDPRLLGALVTRVEMTDDLQLAKVYVRVMEAGPGADAQRRKELLRGLDAASARIRRDVTSAVSLRYAPTFKFYYDEGVEAASRVEELLREIDEEKRRGDKP